MDTNETVERGFDVVAENDNFLRGKNSAEVTLMFTVLSKTYENGLNCRLGFFLFCMSEF